MQNYAYVENFFKSVDAFELYNSAQNCKGLKWEENNVINFFNESE